MADPASFREIFRCAGVDQKVPAGMVVPFGGTNQVVLETGGMEIKVRSNNSGIVVEEFDGKNIVRQQIALNNALYQPDVDPLFREAFLPSQIFHYKPRYLRIHGKGKIGSPGAVIRADPVQIPGRRAPLIGASLQVLCLDTMIIKVAIRRVLARDKDGSIRPHARQPTDPKAELRNMNVIWTPQANIRFELVPSTDLLIDHNDRATQDALKKTYGMKETSTASFDPESVIDSEKVRDLFARHRVKGAHITFFLVHHLGGPAGRMNVELGQAFIAGNHFPTTFAHEAGHYLGRRLVNGQWTPHEHLGLAKLRMLMREGGSSWAIPFEMVRRVRAFSGKPA